MLSNVTVSYWGDHHQQAIYVFKITNSSGSYVEILNYGATIIHLVVPDKNGKMGNVVLGYNDFQSYLNDRFYMGSTIGRCANRIRDARFKIGDKTYHLDKNDGEHTNHGGFEGYDCKFFKGEVIDHGVCMTLTDQNGAGGYPGTIELKVTFIWTDANELIIRYDASTDRSTIANFTNHAYFNLSDTRKSILPSWLKVDADFYLENDENHLPTGEFVKDADGFIGGRLLQEVVDERQPLQTGLNRYYISLKKGTGTKPQAELYDPASGRRLQVFSSYPGILIYTAQYLESYSGKEGCAYAPLSGICLECQHYPDAINHKHFPSIVLSPDKRYQEFIKFRFDTDC